ncbi:MAG: RNA polymerase sigma factor [Saprospiraceae bacterium]|nr:RNA polymerase sigma factor [Saprospiraceae bacterium]
MTLKNNTSTGKLYQLRPASYNTAYGSNVDTNTLVEMIIDKNERGFYILYERYSDVLYVMLLKFVVRTELADDLLQDTFVKIWKNIDRFDPVKGTLFTWMLRIARNQAIDFLRSSSYQQQLRHVDLDLFLPQIDQKNNTPSKTGELEFNDFKHKALLHLGQKHAEVIDMIFFYGWTYEQTATILKLPIGTVKTRARKGLGIIKVLYAE